MLLFYFLTFVITVMITAIITRVIIERGCAGEIMIYEDDDGKQIIFLTTKEKEKWIKPGNVIKVMVTSQKNPGV